MKRIMTLLVAILTFGTFTAQAGDDRTISVDKLPQPAKTFIQTHFAKETVSLAKVDKEFFDTTYKVIFTNSSKVEFNKSGEWKEVDCKFTSVPMAIVPQQIASLVAKQYPNTTIIKIDRDSKDYEVKLSNGLELKFDLKYNLIDIDN